MVEKLEENKLTSSEQLLIQNEVRNQLSRFGTFIGITSFFGMIAIVAAFFSFFETAVRNTVEREIKTQTSIISNSISGLVDEATSNFIKSTRSTEKLAAELDAKNREIGKRTEKLNQIVNKSETLLGEGNEKRIKELFEALENSQNLKSILDTQQTLQSSLDKNPTFISSSDRENTGDLAILFGQIETKETNWKAWVDKDGKVSRYTIYADVSFGKDSFKVPPNVFTSITGISKHRLLTGVSSIYNLTKDGFTVYLRSIEEITPDLAIQNEWQINWIAIAPKNI